MNKDYFLSQRSKDSISILEAPKSTYCENLIKHFQNLSIELDRETSISLEESYIKALEYKDKKIYKKKMPPFFRKPIKWLIEHPIHSLFLFLSSSIGTSILFTAGGVALLGACVTFTFVMIGGSAMFHLSKKNNIKTSIRNDRNQKENQLEKLENNLKEKTKEIENLIEKIKNDFENLPKIQKDLGAKVEAYLKLVNLLNEKKSEINLIIKEMKAKKPKLYFHLQSLKIFDLEKLENSLVSFKKQTQYPSEENSNFFSLKKLTTNFSKKNFEGNNSIYLKENLLGGKNKIEEKNIEEIRKQRLKIFKI